MFHYARWSVDSNPKLLISWELESSVRDQTVSTINNNLKVKQNCELWIMSPLKDPKDPNGLQAPRLLCPKLESNVRKNLKLPLQEVNLICMKTWAMIFSYIELFYLTAKITLCLFVSFLGVMGSRTMVQQNFHYLKLFILTSSSS